MPAAGLAVNVFDDQIDYPDTDYQVVKIQICVAYHQDQEIKLTGFAVEVEDIYISNTIQYGNKEQRYDYPALVFTRRKVPAFCSQYNDEDGYAYQVSNEYRLQIDRVSHKRHL